MGIIVIMLSTFLTIVLLAIVVFVIWAGSARKPQIEALEAMEFNDLVDVTTDRWLVFCPKEKNLKLGLYCIPVLGLMQGIQPSGSGHCH